MTILNLEAVRTAALAALEAEGDHVYEYPREEQTACSYTTPEGGASCLVGHVIARLEPEILPALTEAEWIKDEGLSFTDVAAFGADSLNLSQNRFGSDKEYSNAALTWLSTAQGKQDIGTAWSEAIKEADLYTSIDHADTDEDRAYITAIKAGAVAQ